ncbi:hypothetical protein BDV23DRAFT_151066 [Aspergillus alliaceus]|uniref:Uncharacterized protein n=1 Tax=Petromyces alliaceus TaxID=209559 RepID=A0A5N7CFM3_PETAA|nr:hypothetical protein BDV23DRAFT_151066 [Aspergillus alliaceus]
MTFSWTISMLNNLAKERKDCRGAPAKINDNNFLPFVHLPFEFKALSQPEKFKSFRLE